MSESSTRGGSRWRNFLLMLPFFLIGVAIPVYFFGFTGDGPPQITTMGEPSFSPVAPGAAPDQGAYDQRSSRNFGIVAFARDIFETAIDTYVSPNLSKQMIVLGTLVVLFVVGFLVVRVILALFSGVLGGVFGFLVHKAAGPMFMGFLAVGSTWGIHQTVAQQFGLTWAATTVSLTAAIAVLFALAGVRLRG